MTCCHSAAGPLHPLYLLTAVRTFRGVDPTEGHQQSVALGLDLTLLVCAVEVVYIIFCILVCLGEYAGGIYGNVSAIGHLTQSQLHISRQRQKLQLGRAGQGHLSLGGDLDLAQDLAAGDGADHICAYVHSSFRLDRAAGHCKVCALDIQRCVRAGNTGQTGAVNGTAGDGELAAGLAVSRGGNIEGSAALHRCVGCQSAAVQLELAANNIGDTALTGRQLIVALDHAGTHGIHNSQIAAVDREGSDCGGIVGLAVQIQVYAVHSFDGGGSLGSNVVRQVVVTCRHSAAGPNLPFHSLVTMRTLGSIGTDMGDLQHIAIQRHLVIFRHVLSLAEASLIVAHLVVGLSEHTGSLYEDLACLVQLTHSDLDTAGQVCPVNGDLSFHQQLSSCIADGNVVKLTVAEAHRGIRRVVQQVCACSRGSAAGNSSVDRGQVALGIDVAAVLGLTAGDGDVIHSQSALGVDVAAQIGSLTAGDSDILQRHSAQGVYITGHVLGRTAGNRTAQQLDLAALGIDVAADALGSGDSTADDGAAVHSELRILRQVNRTALSQLTVFAQVLQRTCVQGKLAAAIQVDNTACVVGILLRLGSAGCGDDALAHAVHNDHLLLQTDAEGAGTHGLDGLAVQVQHHLKVLGACADGNNSITFDICIHVVVTAIGNSCAGPGFPMDFGLTMLAVAGLACFAGIVACDIGVQDLTVFGSIHLHTVAHLQLHLTAKDISGGADIEGAVPLMQLHIHRLACVILGAGDLILQSDLGAVDLDHVPVGTDDLIHILDPVSAHNRVDHVALGQQAEGAGLLIHSSSHSLILGLHFLDLAIHHQLEHIPAVSIGLTGGLLGLGIVHTLGVVVHFLHVAAIDVNKLGLAVHIQIAGDQIVDPDTVGVLALMVIVGRAGVVVLAIGSRLKAAFDAGGGYCVNSAVLIDGGHCAVKRNTHRAGCLNGIEGILHNTVLYHQAHCAGCHSIHSGCDLSVLGLDGGLLALVGNVEHVPAFRVLLTGGDLLGRVVLTAQVPIQVILTHSALGDEDGLGFLSSISVNEDQVAFAQSGLRAQLAGTGEVVYLTVGTNNAVDHAVGGLVGHRRIHVGHEGGDVTGAQGGVAVDTLGFVGPQDYITIQGQRRNAVGRRIDGIDHINVLGLEGAGRILAHLYHLDGVPTLRIRLTAGLHLAVHSFVLARRAHIHRVIGKPDSNIDQNGVVFGVSPNGDTVTLLQGFHRLALAILCQSGLADIVDLAVGAECAGELRTGILAGHLCCGEGVAVYRGHSIAVAAGQRLQTQAGGLGIGDVAFLVKHQTGVASQSAGLVDSGDDRLVLTGQGHTFAVTEKVDVVHTVFIGNAGGLLGGGAVKLLCAPVQAGAGGTACQEHVGGIAFGVEAHGHVVHNQQVSSLHRLTQGAFLLTAVQDLQLLGDLYAGGHTVHSDGGVGQDGSLVHLLNIDALVHRITQVNGIGHIDNACAVQL